MKAALVIIISSFVVALAAAGFTLASGGSAGSTFVVTFLITLFFLGVGYVLAADPK